MGARHRQFGLSPGSAASLMAWFTAGLVVSGIAWGDGFQEGFEGPETSWRLVDSDCRPCQVVRHERRFDDAREGRGSEVIQLVAGQGTYAYLAHVIPASRVIPELVPSVWLKADRQGIQLMARVVLPRERKDGRPLTIMLSGDRYEQSGSWQNLRIEELAKKLRQEVIGLRTLRGAEVDSHEAYIDLLILSAYTGPGPVALRTDEMRLDGFAAARPVGDAQESSSRPSDTNFPAPPTLGTPGVPTMVGNVLVVDGAPLLVRAIEHRGESFAFLQSLGCNVVVLGSRPTASQVAEAERCGLWLIAPPDLADREQGGSARVLAWHLGEKLTGSDWSRVTDTIAQLTRRDGDRRLPVVGHLKPGASAGREPDLVPILEHPVLHTSFDMQDYLAWLETAAGERQRQLPFWVAISTEREIELEAQIRRLAPPGADSGTLEPHQLRWLAWAAIGSGARGIWFRSRERLDGQDPAARLRAAALAEVNRELELAAPWAAGGTPGLFSADDQSRVRVRMLETERARLLIVLRRSADLQYVLPPPGQSTVQLPLHHVPPTDQVYSVSLADVAVVSGLRGAGWRVELDEAEVVSLVLLTSDPLAINYVARASAQQRSPAAAARLAGTQILLEQTEAVEGSVRGRGANNSGSDGLLAEARAHWRRAESLLATGDAAHAWQAASQTLARLQHLRTQRWLDSTRALTSPVATPLCTSYATLPAHYALGGQLATVEWSRDLLAAGEMESLEHLLESGWQQQRGSVVGVSGEVRLSLDAAREGRSSLHLRAWETATGSYRLDGESPVVIRSAAIQVQEGQLLRVHGWARVPSRLHGSWDGVMVYDSHTGPALAERIVETQGWREFTLYRVAHRTGPWYLNLALTGLGEAWIDAMSVTTPADLRRFPDSRVSSLLPAVP